MLIILKIILIKGKKKILSIFLKLKGLLHSFSRKMSTKHLILSSHSLSDILSIKNGVLCKMWLVQLATQMVSCTSAFFLQEWMAILWSAGRVLYVYFPSCQSIENVLKGQDLIKSNYFLLIHQGHIKWNWLVIFLF